MLNRFKLNNFKAWREADLALGRVTGFFGPNSAGKSSLLQFLLLLKQTKNATDRGLVLDFGGRESLANLGTFEDVIHRHDRRRPMDWLLDWTLAEKTGDLPEGDKLKIECSVGWRNERLSAKRMAYEHDGDGVYSLQSSKQVFKLVPKGKKELLKRLGRPSLPSPPVKMHLFPDQLKNSYQNAEFLGDFELAYENLMDSIYYLGPLREYPQREYHWGGASPSDVGRRGEFAMDAVLAATRDDNGKRRLQPKGPGVPLQPFQKIIAHWLKELAMINDFSLKEISPGTNLYRAMIKTTPRAVPTPLTDVGFGVSQVLPVLVLLYYVPEGATVLMEQPEIHLHPAVQSGLADVMLNVAKVRNLQIVVESHSEHLMRRLQRRVAEGKESPEDVKLYFVKSKEGIAYAEDLRLNEWGEIENWPPSFFGDELGEVSAIAEASLTRKMKRQSAAPTTKVRRRAEASTSRGQGGVKVDVDVAALSEEYLSGVSMQKLAKKFQISTPTVRRRLVDAGVKIKPPGKPSRSNS